MTSKDDFKIRLYYSKRGEVRWRELAFRQIKKTTTTNTTE